MYLPPRGVKFNKEMIMLCKFLIKVGISKNKHTFIYFGFSNDGAHRQQGRKGENLKNLFHLFNISLMIILTINTIHNL